MVHWLKIGDWKTIGSTEKSHLGESSQFCASEQPPPPISLGRHYERTVAPLPMTSLAAGKRRLCERAFAIFASFLGEAKKAVLQVPNKGLFSVECEPVQLGHCAAREPGWPPEHINHVAYRHPVAGSDTIMRSYATSMLNVSRSSSARFTSLQAARMTRVPLPALS